MHKSLNRLVNLQVWEGVVFLCIAHLGVGLQHLVCILHTLAIFQALCPYNEYNDYSPIKEKEIGRNRPECPSEAKKEVKMHYKNLVSIWSVFLEIVLGNFLRTSFWCSLKTIIFIEKCIFCTFCVFTTNKHKKPNRVFLIFLVLFVFQHKKQFSEIETEQPHIYQLEDLMKLIKLIGSISYSCLMTMSVSF